MPKRERNKFVKRGQILELKIEDYAFGGKGIARIRSEHGEFIVFIPNTIPGQTVEEGKGGKANAKETIQIGNSQEGKGEKRTGRKPCKEKASKNKRAGSGKTHKSQREGKRKR